MAEKKDKNEPLCPLDDGRIAMLKEKRYSMQEMIMFIVISLLGGNVSGGVLFGGGNQEPIRRIENKLSTMEGQIKSLGDKVQDLVMSEKIRKEKDAK